MSFFLLCQLLLPHLHQNFEFHSNLGLEPAHWSWTEKKLLNKSGDSSFVLLHHHLYATPHSILSWYMLFCKNGLLPRPKLYNWLDTFLLSLSFCSLSLFLGSSGSSSMEQVSWLMLYHTIPRAPSRFNHCTVLSQFLELSNSKAPWVLFRQDQD